MLSKQEAGDICDMIARFTRHPSSSLVLEALYKKIESLTEKPKREIKVGDIYPNFEEELYSIAYIDKDEDPYPIIANAIYRSWGAVNCYTKDGIYHIDGLFNSKNLDLSRPHKIIEIKNNNGENKYVN